MLNEFKTLGVFVVLGNNRKPKEKLVPGPDRESCLRQAARKQENETSTFPTLFPTSSLSYTHSSCSYNIHVTRQDVGLVSPLSPLSQ